MAQPRLDIGAPLRFTGRHVKNGAELVCSRCRHTSVALKRVKTAGCQMSKVLISAMPKD